jgi:hypothetical protein
MGTLSFFVNLNEAEVAPTADLSARWSACMGTSRLMVLPGDADWIMYVSKTLSIFKTDQT